MREEKSVGISTLESPKSALSALIVDNNKKCAEVKTSFPTFRKVVKLSLERLIKTFLNG